MKMFVLFVVIFLTTSTGKAQILPKLVTEKLNAVPIFLLSDENGSYLAIESPPPNQAEKVISLFFTLAAAQSFQKQLLATNLETARKVKVTTATLDAVYTRQLQEQSVSPSTVWRYVADSQEVAAAQKLLAPDSTNKPQPDDVPLFAARTTKGYLTINQNGKTLIPIFFSFADLQTSLAALKRQSPFLAFVAQIQVLPLKSVLESLTTDAALSAGKIIFMPFPDAYEPLKLIPATAKPTKTPVKKTPK